MPIQVTCSMCGTDFLITPSRFEKSSGSFFCKKDCETQFKTSEPNVICAVCDKTFHVKPYRLKRLTKDEHICCSKECTYKLKEFLYCGDNNHQFGLKGELNSSFKRDFMISRFGYLLIRCITHPFRQERDFVFFHRLVMEEHLRNNYPDSDYLINVDGVLYLDPDVVVHHKNQNKFDNRLDNLECMLLGDHVSLHNKIRGKKKSSTTSATSLLKKHVYDAGLDIVSNADVMLLPNSSIVIATDLYIQIPDGCVGLIWSRSGLSVKNRLEVGAGCIDSTYRGEVKVHLYNHDSIHHEIKKGDKIAQLLTIPININVYDEVAELTSTERDDGGFGSTGR